MKTTDTEHSRYVVGIDLGTTNSAVCYVDSHEEPWRIRTFAVPQLVAPGQVEARETLPSFHYQPAGGELKPGALSLPWTAREPASEKPALSYAVGVFAREHGRVVPGRLIDSAKSWLCHPGVDRTAPLLPWHPAADVDRLSPVEVSARYIDHIRRAWDAAFPAHPLSEQDVVLTLPASFDEVARELTVQAAKQAGLPRIVLIEEPQAAFYSWIDAHRDDWHRRVEAGQKILVCDIGGGTSDFTLIQVRPASRRREPTAAYSAGCPGSEPSGAPSESRSGGSPSAGPQPPDDDGETDSNAPVRFHRVAVGEHLILGGDNLDLALAHHVERRLAGDGKLPPRQWSVLVGTCRQLKERLLSPDAPDKVTANLPGAGSKLIGGAVQFELTREEIRNVLLDGFVPPVALEEKPDRRRSGFQEFGLPYASDPAITRHLAAFLTAHRDVVAGESDWPEGKTAGTTASRGRKPTGTNPEAHASGPPSPETASRRDAARPDIVLFNGGLFASPVLRERLLDVLCSWFRNDEPDWKPQVLANERLDLAVARGAAYYGMVCRGEGVRIAAGLARTYYVGVESAEPAALCLVPAGVEPGTEVDLAERTFQLSLSEPVEFPLYVSSIRLTDAAGSLVPVEREQMTPLPPIRTVLKTSRKQDRGPAIGKSRAAEGRVEPGAPAPPSSRGAGASAVVSVKLHARLTEIGTLELWCSEVGGRRSWQLQFDVRAATQTDAAAHTGRGERQGVLETETAEICRRIVSGVFGKEGDQKPGGLPRRIAREIHVSRSDWPTTLLREIWEALMQQESGRRKSEQHEARWLNLLGFALRPGYGLAVDDWRVAETWRVLQGRLVHSTPMCRAEWWILWRRIAGGLEAGQQKALATPLLGLIRQKHRQLTTGKGKGADYASSTHEEAEIWRLLGSLELLPLQSKLELGRIILDLLPKKKMEAVQPALTWALGRLGGRVPVYGPLNTVLAPADVADWIARLTELQRDNVAQLAVMQLARRTDDRYRDLAEPVREAAAGWLEDRDAPAHFVELVRRGGTLQEEEQDLVFGETLPKGLRIL